MLGYIAHRGLGVWVHSIIVQPPGYINYDLTHSLTLTDLSSLFLVSRVDSTVHEHFAAIYSCSLYRAAANIHSARSL